MNTRLGLLLLATLALLVPALTVAVDPASGQSGGIADADVIAQPDGVDADTVRITVRLREDGTAEWTLNYRTVLDSENRTQAFESLQADISNDPDAYTAPFADRIRNTVATAENATGREMAAEGFSIDTTKQSLARDYGIVTYQFTWTNFATTSDDTISAGDAIDGYYLADGTKLRIEWPSNYARQSVAPEPDETHENAVAWVGGQTDFVSGQPRVTVAPSGPGIGLIGGIAAVVLLALVAAWFVIRRRGDDDAAAATPTAAADTATADSDATADAGAADADTAVDTETADSTADAEAADTESTADEESSEPDPELLSNEEQVMKLLDENGGRMKQKQVVEELGWTDAKTSKVVSGLREEGEIESFRIGRENVLTFPDEGLTDE